jgi:hypothetical protein
MKPMRIARQQGFALIAVMATMALVMLMAAGFYNAFFTSEANDIDQLLARQRAYWAMMGNVNYMLSRAAETGLFCPSTSGTYTATVGYNSTDILSNNSNTSTGCASSGSPYDADRITALTRFITELGTVTNVGNDWTFDGNALWQFQISSEIMAIGAIPGSGNVAADTTGATVNAGNFQINLMPGALPGVTSAAFSNNFFTQDVDFASPYGTDSSIGAIPILDTLRTQDSRLAVGFCVGDTKTGPPTQALTGSTNPCYSNSEGQGKILYIRRLQPAVPKF